MCVLEVYRFTFFLGLGFVFGIPISVWPLLISKPPCMLEETILTYLWLSMSMSILLRLTFAHYELPITYIKKTLTEILIYRS